MQAVRIHETDGPESVKVESVPELELLDGSVLVDVHAAGVSFPDLLMSRGEYQIRPEPPFTMGSEGAGVVREAANGSAFKPGDRVAFLTLGAWAETALAGETMAFPLPDELDFDAGAALVINYHTALFALRHRGALSVGETVLVHGAAGGVGSAAIQVAKALGARVLAVVSTADKATLALQAGADEIVHHGDEWLQKVRELTGGRGVDMVFDPVGGKRFTDSLRSLAEGGRLLVIGFAEGEIPEVKVNRLLLRNTSVIGVAWGAYVGSRPDLAREIGEAVNAMVRSGAVQPLVGERLPLARAADALRLLERRAAIGKVVLQTR